jgi:hypothetical protein
MVCMRCARRREKIQLKRGSYAAYTRIIVDMCGAYADQQNLSVKNPKHQADIEATLSHAQRGARLERSRYNQVPTRSCHPHTQRPPKVAMESNTPMKTESMKDGHNRLKKPQESMSSGEPT